MTSSLVSRFVERLPGRKTSRRPMARIAVLVGAVAMLTASGLAWADPVAFEPPLIDRMDPAVYKAPKVYPVPAMDQGDVKAIFYQGLPYQGHETRVFAYLGVPKTPAGKPTAGKKGPAMVLVHGGGGTAFPEWVAIWNQRGYAAIAMDLEGHVPTANPRQHAPHEHSGPVKDRYFFDGAKPLQEQWGYHAVADVMLAQSLLASLPEVDPDRIGLTGISWGGVMTSMVSGIDARFKCAVPVYGCGFLYESKSAFKNMFDPDPAVFGPRKSWDPAEHFVRAKMPILWMSGDVDAHFSVDILSRSHQAYGGPSRLCIHPGMAHGHRPGYDPASVPELYAFVDSILCGGTPLGRIVQQPAGRNAVLKYESPCAVVSAQLRYRTEPLTYVVDKGRYKLEGEWKTADAQVIAKDRTVKADLPDGVVMYYINLRDDRGCILSSNLIQVK